VNSGLTSEVDEKAGSIGDLGEKSSDKLALWGLAVLLVYSVVRNVFAALAKPFWFDELLTFIIARQQSFLATWNAAGSSRDGNPPLFYVVERLFATFPANEHIAYRLASILGFAGMIAFLFVFVRRRNGGSVALICVSTLLLTPLLRPYAVEARPYGLVAACLAVALVCYQHAPKLQWMLLMGIALAAAEGMHYYSLFDFVPIAIAEAVATIRIRRLRWSVWLAVAVGLIPLAVFWPLLNEIRRYYGAHIWNPPSLFVTAASYALLFKTNAPIALALVATLAALVLFTSARPSTTTSSQERMGDDNERWLAVTFLALPLLVFIAAKITHGAYTARYVLPSLFGVPISLAYVFRLIGRKGIALIAVFTFMAVGLQEAFFWQTGVHDALHFNSPAAPIESIVNRSGYPELPVVVSDGQDYFQFIHYAADARRFVTLVDPDAAVAYSGSNTLDLELPVMRCCMAIQVYTFPDFAAQHATFLLYSGGGQWDWWAARLVNDGDSLQLLAEDQNRRVYLVQLKTNASANVSR
jgi:hypothetical protein